MSTLTTERVYQLNDQELEFINSTAEQIKQLASEWAATKADYAELAIVNRLLDKYGELSFNVLFVALGIDDVEDSVLADYFDDAWLIHDKDNALVFAQAVSDVFGEYHQRKYD